MKIKVTESLKQMNGKPMVDQDDNGKPVEATIRTVLVNALLSPVPEEKGMDKVAKYDLAQRIYKEDEVDLNETDIKLIKDRVGELFAPLVVGQIFNLLKV